nr:hypothetical protein [Tanacetum cinerariifolium]
MVKLTTFDVMCKAYEAKMDFWNFMKEGIDGEFHYLPERGSDDEESSISTPYVHDAPLEKDEVTLIDRSIADKAQNQKVSASLKAAANRKQTDESFEKEPRQKVQKVPPQVSRAYGDASDPLDVDIW